MVMLFIIYVPIAQSSQQRLYSAIKLLSEYAERRCLTRIERKVLGLDRLKRGDIIIAFQSYSMPMSSEILLNVEFCYTTQVVSIFILIDLIIDDV